MMHGHEKSDPAVVAVKPANEAGQPAEERVEPRAGTEGNAGRRHAPGAEPGKRVPRAGPRTESRKERKKEKFTALLHHVDVDALAEAFYDLKRTPRRAWTADVEGLRDGSRAQARGSAFAGPPGSVSGDCPPAGLYSQTGWTAAPVGGRRAGGQDRPTGDGDGAERHLRGGFPRLQLRVPTGARRA